MLKELRRWKELQVLGTRITDPKQMKGVISMRWRHTWKGIQHNRQAKSRLVASGFQDPRDRGWVETYSGTSEAGQVRITIVYGLSRGWRAAKADIKTAIIQMPAKDTVRLKMRLPDELPPKAKELGFESGAVHEQLKAIYAAVR